MKKISKIIVLASAFLFVLISACALSKTEKQTYKVIKIVDGDTFYIDFNNNNFPNKNERVRLNGIDCFENKVNDGLKLQQRKYNLSQTQVLFLGNLGYLYAKEELLGKNVEVKYSAKEKTDKYNRPLVSIYYQKDSKKYNFEKEILKQGYCAIFPYSNLARRLKKYENPDLIYSNLKTIK